ncbi:MAG: AAA family ATPase [Granulosicoccaceae bacterium]
MDNNAPMEMSSTASSATGSQPLDGLRRHMRRVLIGQDQVVEQVLICLLAGGHALVEGVPGLGKTRLVKALATACGGSFNRLQFTPDLMPSDIVGHAMFNASTSEFSLRKGPIFANFVVADEINRAPAKTQSAMLEAMEERQVSLEGESLALPAPFMVLATQNPVDHDGTYDLPQAQFDRFLMKLVIEYPAFEDEVAVVQAAASGKNHESISTTEVISLELLKRLQVQVATVHLDKEVAAYAVRLATATRQWPGLEYGAGPRASMALVAAGRAHAILQARDHLLPEDIKAVAVPVLQHRLGLSAEMEIQGSSVPQVLTQLIDSVEAPRQ